jgi:hypothetical protein
MTIYTDESITMYVDSPVVGVHFSLISLNRGINFTGNFESCSGDISGILNTLNLAADSKKAKS